MPKFFYKFVDGVVLTNKNTRQKDLDFFAKQGIEPRKVILWNVQGTPEFFNLRMADGAVAVFMDGLEFHIRKPEDEQLVGETFWRLQRQNSFYSLDPAQFPAILAQSYRQFHGKPLDWNNLKTYTEKMQWIKLYDNTPIKTRLADKFLVRHWIADKIGDEYLIPLLGVWENFDEIDFDALPNQFVLKCNHGSGMNIICRDKKDFDIEKAREKINAWLAIDYGSLYFEPLYNNIHKKIIAEKFIEDMDGGLNDYKIHCFGGEPKFIQTIGDRDMVNHTGHQNFYDFSWNKFDWTFEDYPNFPREIKKPVSLDKMRILAQKLSSDLKYVRVDFYEIGGKIYFGEMTFIPAAGNYPYKETWTIEKDLKLGSLMTINKK